MNMDETAKVRTDRMSRVFDISRGTKQGDPLSSLLFNALLEKVLTKVKSAFAEKKYGVQMGFGSLENSSKVLPSRLRDYTNTVWCPIVEEVLLEALAAYLDFVDSREELVGIYVLWESLEELQNSFHFQRSQGPRIET